MTLPGQKDAERTNERPLTFEERVAIREDSYYRRLKVLKGKFAYVNTGMSYVIKGEIQDVDPATLVVANLMGAVTVVSLAEIRDIKVLSEPPSARGEFLEEENLSAEDRQMAR